MKNVRRFLLKNKIAPKWLIFVLDLAICCCAIIYANYLRVNFDLTLIHFSTLADDLLIGIVTNSALFYFFQTHHGIIRFSGFQEALRSIAAVFYSFAIMLVLNLILEASSYGAFTPNSVLFIYFFISSFSVFGYRLIVKHLYKVSINESQTTNIVIYGAELNGSLLKKTIEGTKDNRYRIVAFIDDDENLLGKTIDNVKIYSFGQVQNVVKALQVKKLFFARHDLAPIQKNKIVDYCLAQDIKVMNIPPMQEWMAGRFNMKEVDIVELLGRPQINLKNEHVLNLLRNKNVLITGAAGSIGSELARQVAGIYPASLIILDQTESGLYEMEYELQKNYQLGNSLKVFLGDVKNEEAMKKMFEQYMPDIVFHAAAYKHVPMMEKHPSEAVVNNVLGTKVLADLSAFYGVERFLFVSTDKAINPSNVMGASKRIAEIYCHSLQTRKRITVIDEGVIPINGRTSKTKFITTRFGNVLGSNGSVIPRFHEQISKGGPVTVTHPDIIRYFMTIPEACSLVLEAVSMGNGGEVFVFDMGEPVKILDLATKMVKLAGLTPGKDIQINFTGLRPGEKLYEEILSKGEKVLETHNKKILVSKSAEYDYKTISESLEIMISMAVKNKDKEVVTLMKQMVPEYISNNSVYEAIDEEALTATLSSHG